MSDPPLDARRTRRQLAALVAVVIAISIVPWLMTSRQRPLRHLRAWAIGATLLDDRGVLFQRTDADCGHTALMIVLDRFRKAVPIELVRAAKTDRYGLSIDDIKARSIAADLSARIEPVRADCLADTLSRVPLPAIALVGNHYIVVEQPVDASGRVTIIDPALGRLRLPLEPLSEGWRGYLITFGAVTSGAITACSGPA